jgi:hypothetical protein
MNFCTFEHLLKGRRPPACNWVGKVYNFYAYPIERLSLENFRRQTRSTFSTVQGASLFRVNLHFVRASRRINYRGFQRKTGGIPITCINFRVGRILWCPKLESRGTSLEKVSYRNIRIHHAKQGCFGRLTVRATCCTRNIFKKPCAIGEIDIFTCFGPVLYEGSVEEV